MTFFLLQNGVLAARRNADSALVEELHAAGVELLADQFSLRERGIVGERLAAKIGAAELDVVLDQLADGCTTLWH